MAQFAGDFNKPELGSTPGPQPALTPSPAYPPNLGITQGNYTPAIGAALQWAETNLGGPVVEQETTLAVASLGTQVIDGNGDRVGLVFINTSGNDLVLALTLANAVALNGIRIAANGGAVSMIVRDDMTLCTRRWYAAGASGATAIYVLELIRFSLTPKGK